MNKTVTFWLPIVFALVLAGVGLLSQQQGWSWSGWLTAAAIIVPLVGSAIWAFLKKDPEGDAQSSRS